MRYLPLILAISLPAISSAETYISENFANYIPSTFTVVNVDGGSMQPYTYNRMGNDPKAAWVAGQLANGYGRAALCPTRRDGAETPADRRMILPAVSITSGDAVVQWEARSLHKHCPESYRVAIREAGSQDWTDLYVCEAESGYWAQHSVSLEQYTGRDVEIAFIATTAQGFILAVDNIFVGVRDDHKVTFASRTPHYVGDDGAVTVSGTLTYYGVTSPWASVELAVGDEVQTAVLPTLHCGESVDVEFTLYPTLGQRYDYRLTAVGDGVRTELYSDFICCSYYGRTQVIDRGSGTWCPNCPPMELTTSRLERKYGDEVIILDTHINDVLTNADYWRTYLEGNVYSIPCLIPNHDLSRNTASLKTTDDFSSKLDAQTIAKTEVSAWYTETGEVRAASHTVFAMDVDNTGDRYRIGYMLIGDIHDPMAPQYMQALSVSNFNGDQYYYMPDNIMPQMMYFDNVPLSAETAYRGVPASLSQTLPAATEMSHEYTLAIADTKGAEHLRVLAMVIDTNDGTVINAALAAVGSPTGITDITSDHDDTGLPCYDLSGRRVHPSTSGIVIRGQGAEDRNTEGRNTEGRNTEDRGQKYRKIYNKQ